MKVHEAIEQINARAGDNVPAQPSEAGDQSRPLAGANIEVSQRGGHVLEARFGLKESARLSALGTVHAEATEPPVEDETRPVARPIDAALEYAQRGWPVLPLHNVVNGGRCSCGSLCCGSPAKHPRTLHGLKDATTDERRIHQWWKQWPDANIGIVTGTASGLVVLDVDDPAAFDRLREIGELPVTRRVRTARGSHLYFEQPVSQPLRTRTAFIPSVDLRADGSFVVAPPSTHASGVQYQFVDASDPITPMPQWLVNLVTTTKIIPEAPAANGVFGEGERNTRLARIGGSLVRHGITGDALDAILEATNSETCRPPLEGTEVERVARSVERYVARPEVLTVADDAVERVESHRPTGAVSGGGRSRFKLFSIQDVLSEPSPEWRVEGLLPVGALSMIYAPQEQFKTFFGLDVALSVAHGTEFHGRQVKPGPTVYVLGEGRGGLKNRIRAWIQEHGVKHVDGAFFVLEAVQFKRPDDVKALRAQIEAQNMKPAMLFIDTFARSAVGIDENDAMHVGVWIDAVTTLQHEMNVDVVALHHAQKAPNDDKKGKSVRERGSTAFIGAVDTVIRLTKDHKKVKVTCEKQKDAEHFAPFTLGVKIVDLGLNEHEEPASSCVLVDPEDPAAEAHGLSQHHRAMLMALNEFPVATADRREWMPRTSLKERTFDRYRNELLTGKRIESAERGVYKITSEGLAAIANELPTTGHGGTTQDVAATPPPPRGGGVATGLAAPSGDNDLGALREALVAEVKP